VPLGRNDLFVGRSTDLQALAAALKGGPSVPTAVVTGVGGLGKTQLAAEFVYRYGRYFAGGGALPRFAHPSPAAAPPGPPAGAGPASTHWPSTSGSRWCAPPGRAPCRACSCSTTARAGRCWTSGAPRTAARGSW